MKKGKRVYIKELNQFAKVASITEEGKAHIVEIQTAGGPQFIDVIEKGYNLATLISTILGLIFKYLKHRGESVRPLNVQPASEFNLFGVSTILRRNPFSMGDEDYVSAQILHLAGYVPKPKENEDTQK